MPRQKEIAQTVPQTQQQSKRGVIRKKMTGLWLSMDKSLTQRLSQ